MFLKMRTRNIVSSESEIMTKIFNPRKQNFFFYFCWVWIERYLPLMSPCIFSRSLFSFVAVSWISLTTENRDLSSANSLGKQNSSGFREDRFYK